MQAKRIPCRCSSGVRNIFSVFENSDSEVFGIRTLHLPHTPLPPQALFSSYPLRTSSVIRFKPEAHSRVWVPFTFTKGIFYSFSAISRIVRYRVSVPF